MADDEKSRVDRPLTENQRIFVLNMVYDRMDKIDAYANAFGIDLRQADRNTLASRASRLFYQDNVQKYYTALSDEVAATQQEKGLWTREMATKKLLKLMEKVERDIYEGDAPVTMARLQAVILSAKELNSMHGYNQTNVKVEGCVVQISGEDKLED